MRRYLGEVKYKRTYFESKKTGEFAYLSDEVVGIEVYDRIKKMNAVLNIIYIV